MVKILALLLVSATLTAGFFACGAGDTGGAAGQPAGQSAGQPAGPELLKPVESPADLAPVTRGDIQVLKVAEGSVVPYSEELGFLSSDAPILAIHVTHGQSVEEGELLAELDESVWMGRLDEARGELTHAERVLAHEDRLAEIAIERAEIELAAAAGGEGETDARLNLEELQTRDRIRRETAELDSERLRARIAQLESQKDDYKIYAPFDGVILHIAGLQPGAYPSGREPFLHIADLGRLTVHCATEQTSFFSGSQSLYAVIGDVELPVELIPYSLQEQLAFYYEGITPPARFSFGEGAAELLGVEDGGTSVRTAPTDKRVLIKAYGIGREDVLTIPINAAHLETGSAEDGSASRMDYTYVDVNGARERRDIRVGLRSDVRIEVLEGLAEGEMIYVD